MPALPSPALMVITDRTQARGRLEDVAEAAFCGGCRWLSLREKDLEADERLALLRRLAEIGTRWGATVGVHDDLAAAASVAGAALHLPSGGSAPAARRVLGSGRLIGGSFHTGDDLSDSAVAGLDYVTLSPVFRSASKPGYGPPLGIEGFTRSAREANVPVIALGGIAPDTVAACLAVGAHGVAVMGSVMAASDAHEIVAGLLRRFEPPEAAF